jgi:hypothetical protein
MAKKKAAKKKTAPKKPIATKKKAAPKRKVLARVAKRVATAKKKIVAKVAKATKAAKKRIAKKPVATPSNLTVERVNVRPVVRVSRVEIRLTAKAPVMPASFRPAPAIGVLLPPPSREE